MKCLICGGIALNFDCEFKSCGKNAPFCNDCFIYFITEDDDRNKPRCTCEEHLQDYHKKSIKAIIEAREK